MKARGIVLHTVGVKGDATAAGIRAFHMAAPPKGNGWNDIGYHRVVRKDGHIENGRALFKLGSHLKGANDTLGICVTGDGDTEEWTSAQWESVLGLCAEWCVNFDWDSSHVCGHREGPARFGGEPTTKTCPGKLIDMNEFRRRLAARLKGWS